MKYILLLGALTIGVLSNTKAQVNTTVAYSIAVPLGDLNEYTPKASFRGAVFGVENMVMPNVAVGGSIGWNVFYEEVEYDTYTIENISLSGKQWRYSNHVPMLVTGKYYLLPDNLANPYIGAGIGAMYSRRSTVMSRYSYDLDAWNFTIQPEIGMLLNATDNTNLHISAKYNYGFKSGNELLNSQSFISFNVGLTFVKPN